MVTYVFLLSYALSYFVIYVFSVTCYVLLHVPVLFSCINFILLLLGRDCCFSSLPLGALKLIIYFFTYTSCKSARLSLILYSSQAGNIVSTL